VRWYVVRQNNSAGICDGLKCLHAQLFFLRNQFLWETFYALDFLSSDFIIMESKNIIKRLGSEKIKARLDKRNK